MLEIATFKMDDRYIQKFKRYNKQNKDCVINALELIQLLNPREASIIRVLVGCKGIKGPEIIQLFNTLCPKYRWYFNSYKNMFILNNYVFNKLERNKVMFCGYYAKPGSGGHVFLIGKDNKGIPKYLEPQKNDICDYRESKCYIQLANKAEYFILEREEIKK